MPRWRRATRSSRRRSCGSRRSSTRSADGPVDEDCSRRWRCRVTLARNRGGLPEHRQQRPTLKVGDCFNYTNTTRRQRRSASTCPRSSTARRPHSDEVFSVFDYPERGSASRATRPSARSSRRTARPTSRRYVGVDVGAVDSTRSTYAAPTEQQLGGRRPCRSTACSRTPAAGSSTGSARGSTDNRSR